MLLGIPPTQPAAGPLRWLDPPHVGHPVWNDYLQRRGGLIAERARSLGNLADAYREQYALTHLPPGHLCARPEQGRRQLAYDLATRAPVRPAAIAPPDVTGRHSGRDGSEAPRGSQQPRALEIFHDVDSHGLRRPRRSSGRRSTFDAAPSAPDPAAGFPKRSCVPAVAMLHKVCTRRSTNMQATP